MKGKTIRGVKGDRVRVVIDVDPLDAPLGKREVDYVFVTATDPNNAPDGVCVMLTPRAAEKVADTIYALTSHSPASLRRLKQRIARGLDWMQGRSRAANARFINAAIDAWAEAERKRGAR